MTRNEYLNELGARIVRMPEMERNEALAFYNEYFEDAESDEAAIAALDTPARLAAQIAAEYSARMLEESAQARRETPPPAAPPTYGTPKENTNAPPPGYTRASYTRPDDTTTPLPNYPPSPERKSSLGWIWAVILGIFALPVAVPLLIAALAVVFAVVAVCFALIIALVAVVFALIFGGLFGLFSVGTAAAGPGGILLAAGCAIAALGLGLVLIPLLIRFCAWMIRGVGRLVSGIFSKLKRRTNHENT